MFNALLRLFTPPVFPDDDDKTRVAWVLNMLLLVFLGIIVVNSFAIFFIYVAKLYVALIQTGLFLTFGIAYGLMRRGRIRLASAIFVSVQWIIYTLGLALAGGMTTTVVIFYLANTIVTGLLLGIGAAMAHVVACCLVGLGLVFIDTRGLLPLPLAYPLPPLTNWTLMVISLTLPTTALGLTLHNLQEALARTNQELDRRKVTEQALQESENLFRNTFEQAAVGIGHVSPQGQYLRVNQRLCDLLGYSRDELLGMTYQQITHPEDLAADLAFVQRVLAGEISSYVLEKRYICKDGLIFWANLTIAAVCDADGRINYFMGVVEDITARKVVEEARRESEARFITAFRSNPIPLVMSQLSNFQILDVNETWEAFSGYTHEEAIGTTSVKLGLFVDLAEREYLFHRLEQSGRLAGYELDLKRKSGEVRRVVLSAEIISMAGERVMLSAIQDITERIRAEQRVHESEAQLRAIVDASPDLQFVLDEDGRYIEIETARPELLVANAQVIQGRSIKEFFPEPTVQALLDAIHKTLESGETQIYQYLLEVPAGKRWFEGRMARVSVPIQGKKVVILLARDITERKLAEEALQESREELRALSRHLQTALEEERTNIAREIHDEFGQALTALKMDLAWVMRRLPEESTLRDKLAGAVTLADTTIQLVRQISSELRPGILDDLGLSSAIEWQANEFGQRTGIVCQVTLEGIEIGRGREIETALFRIFQESLTNAARHSGATQIYVRLAEETGQIELRVTDNGRGISLEELAARNSLGLIGMRERARAFGGDVVIEGLEGKGTTVTARFPISTQGVPGESEGKDDPGVNR